MFFSSTSTPREEIQELFTLVSVGQPFSTSFGMRLILVCEDQTREVDTVFFPITSTSREEFQESLTLVSVGQTRGVEVFIGDVGMWTFTHLPFSRFHLNYASSLLL